MNPRDQESQRPKTAASRPRTPLRLGTRRVDPRRPLFILGPCVMESERFTWRMARFIHEIAGELGIQWVFKASYDKANRTSIRSFRGPGPREGCALLGSIGRELGIATTTDIHAPAEAELAAEHVDLLQIPAFLCRQTDLLTAAARTGRAVNVKKGQFLAPWDVRHIAGKLESAGARHYLFTERGTTFGYGDLVADMRSLHWIRRMGYRVVFDATHSVQRPAAAGDRSGGDAALAPTLARAAVAAGVDGIFIETHEKPGRALSDGATQIPLRALRALLSQLVAIHDILR